MYLTHYDFREHHDQEFSRSLVERLVELLENGPVSGLTPNEQDHLIVLIQTTLEVVTQFKVYITSLTRGIS